MRDGQILHPSDRVLQRPFRLHYLPTSVVLGAIRHIRIAGRFLLTPSWPTLSQLAQCTGRQEEHLIHYELEVAVNQVNAPAQIQLHVFPT